MSFRSLIAPVLAVAALGIGAPAASASGSHWCRQGDPPLHVSANASCAFAGNVVTTWVQLGHPQATYVYSSITHRRYAMTFTRWHGMLRAVALPRRLSIWVICSADI